VFLVYDLFSLNSFNNQSYQNTTDEIYEAIGYDLPRIFRNSPRHNFDIGVGRQPAWQPALRKESGYASGQGSS